MPPFGPVSRRDLIHYMRACGYDGPYSGGTHQFMARGDLTVRIPNPHQGSVGKSLLALIQREAGIPREEWESL
jgi:hypothetical protein